MVKMNRVLVDVYLSRRRPRWGRGLEGATAGREKDLDEIVRGDVAVRDKQREKYLADQFEELLNKPIR